MTSFALESAGGYTHDPATYSVENGGAQAPWSWRLTDGSGEEISCETAERSADGLPGGVLAFGSRSDAESWLGEHWRAMEAEGVHSATLLNGDSEVSAPIRLAA